MMHGTKRWITGLVLLLGLTGAHAAVPLIGHNAGGVARCIVAKEDSDLLMTNMCPTGTPGAEWATSLFDFTPSGAIANGDRCLDLKNSAGGKTEVVLSTCTGSASQKWRRDGDFLVSTANNQCLRLGFVLRKKGQGVFSPPPSLVEAPLLDACAYNADRKWALGTVPANWPTQSANKPSALVEGASLTPAQVQKVVNWIYAETKIDSLPFCWRRAAYDRGVGKPQTDCGSKTFKDGLCYGDCRAGYTGVGPVCWQQCPSGYADTGAFCQSRESLSYRPGTTCSTKDKLGTCWAWKMKSCRDGYLRDTITQTCWLKDPTIAKHSYGRGAGTVPQGCTNGLVLQAGMCYDRPRSGYTCTVTACSEQCAAGTMQCGAGCARDVGTCTNSITDMVISPAMALASLATGGAAGAAANSVKAAVSKANEAAKMAATAKELAMILKDSINDYMQAAEGDLTAISTPEIERAVAAKYGKGSANYRSIAREYAQLQIMAAVSNMFTDLSILVTSMVDTTGVVSTINAFAKPLCEQRKPIP